MPFYVSPEQAMKDKADYASKAITRGRSGVVIEYDGGILFFAPNSSRALHKFSEIYDRIAFAAVGRYNEFENLRKAGVRYADMTGFQYDRQDVTARGLAIWYAQLLGTLFTESNKPFEVEIVVAEVGHTPDEDQIYRITFDGSVADEHGFVVMGGNADQVATGVKERFTEGMTLVQALGVAIAGLAGQPSEQRPEIVAAQLEVAILDRTRPHRTFRRLTGARLEGLLAEARQAAPGADGAGNGKDAPGKDALGKDAGGKGPGGKSPGGNGSGGTGSGGADSGGTSGPG